MNADILHAERRADGWSKRGEHRREARFARYVLRARRRISRRLQTLVELGFTYVTYTLCVSTVASRSTAAMICSSIVFIAFGYMIWTVLENKADANEGSGFRLVADPQRWRRNGVEFLRGFGSLAVTSIFAIVWMTTVCLALIVLSGGAVRMQVVEMAHTQLPMIFPQWSAFVVVPLILLPIIKVYRLLMSRARTSAAIPAHPLQIGDRIIWAAVVFLCIFFYLEIRSVFMNLPFPIGQVCSSTLALMLTTTMAAFELGFMDENARHPRSKGHPQ